MQARHTNHSTLPEHSSHSRSTEQQSTGHESDSPSSLPPAPSISLPKGGGAIRGIGEKFTANPVTGTGSLTVPIATSPARSGSGPQLSLSYDSGAGNGPFGLGWQLSPPAITRKTDKGLPRYLDADESDVFLLSGVEDLVPLYQRDQGGGLAKDALGRLVLDEKLREGYRVRRYRPRIESSFTRIERWTRESDSDVHWRSITADNIISVYGKDGKSRIFSSNAGGTPRIFSWLLCESYDGKGNAILYEYKAEDDVGVDLTRSYERNRDLQARSTNRYLKVIKYGNRKANRDDAWTATDPKALPDSTWMFKVVFDYGEHDLREPKPDDKAPWHCREDSSSSYRSGFEIRTHRLCRRVLMFHSFPAELLLSDYLVHSTDITYDENAIATTLSAITHSGYVRQQDQSNPLQYLKRSHPPLEFEYSRAPSPERLSQLPIRNIDKASLENLPCGVDEKNSQWVDLDGEGLSGILTHLNDQSAWYYKRNLSAIHQASESDSDSDVASFGTSTSVSTIPGAIAGLPRFMDLAGDGQLDVVLMEGVSKGFYERTKDRDWDSFRSFDSWPGVDVRDPNLKFVDLTGDGYADIFITHNEEFTWFPSLAENGFDSPERVPQPSDEERGPRLVFADPDMSIYLADFSGDGLTDLVRIRNGDISYWPNLGYGRFGAKVTMANAPWFDTPDQFNQSRIRIADIDGCGTADIIYLGRESVNIYHNQSGNGWSQASRLGNFPCSDQLSTVTTVDLLGNGTICLVWSSPLPHLESRSMYYIDLMDGQKPHLLVRHANNLGAETRIKYVPSTYFYLRDEQEGKPWVTRLPFPTQCVHRIETHDHINHSYFTTRYAYHHGYFDGVEREFNGFGMVEQWDTELIGNLNTTLPSARVANIEESSNIPPVYTKTWFHTGAFLDREKISRHLASEYFGPVNAVLDDTVLPSGDLSTSELREACRSLKGSILRQEVYSEDGKPRASIPYAVSERNYTIEMLQPQDSNHHSVFLTHPRESLSYHFERVLDDPRVQHEMVLEVDEYGNVLKSLAIGYGRTEGRSPLEGNDRTRQEQLMITLVENDVTNAVDTPDDFCTPLGCETRSYQVSGFAPARPLGRFTLEVFTADDFAALRALSEIPHEQDNDPQLRQKRLLGRSRTLYRSNDLTRLLPLGQIETMRHSGESYSLVLTPGLLSTVFQRKSDDGTVENLLPDAAGVLGGRGDGQAGYVDLDRNGHWWVPSGLAFFHPDRLAIPQQELAEARSHFFAQRRFTDPFGNSSTVDYDSHVLLPVQTRDALGNVVSGVNDYRVLAPIATVDSNGNRSEVAFDALGLVVGTAVMGKENERVGDSLSGFRADLTEEEVRSFLTTTQDDQVRANLLANATTRIIYDITRYWREPDMEKKMPVFAASLSRETHASEALPPQGLKIYANFSYSDGFGREVQKKVQAEPGPTETGEGVTSNRWVVSGWTIFNNKGSPVRQYEPFFDDTPEFRFGMAVGVSTIIFYDPMERVVGTLHPDHSWEKVIFNPWRQEAHDTNDTVQMDPKTDSDVGDFIKRLPESEYTPTWYNARISGQLGPHEQAAAVKAAAHSGTPTVTHSDSLGRVFLTVANNGPSGTYQSRINLDFEGHQREVIDAKGRVVMRFEYDMLGGEIHQASMEAGERWNLDNAMGNALFAWNSRKFRTRNGFDLLNRRTNVYLQEGNGPERLVERVVFGETLDNPEARNQRGKAVQVYDQAGVVLNDEYDFKGNLLRSQRQFAQNYKEAPDWAAEVPLEAEVHTNHTSYDALNRVRELKTPDNSAIRYAFSDANLMDRVEVNLRGEQNGDQLVWTSHVTNIDYDAKGQRTLIKYGNGTQTDYTYDAHTFRLSRLQTRRNSDRLQDLSYTYDPVGNITRIRDDAQQTNFFRNTRIEPSTDYTYDAVYRLIEATGREHLGLNSSGQLNAPTAPTHTDRFNTRLDHPGNRQAMGLYSESYTYDATNNILDVKHRGSDPAHPGWTRTYDYRETSQLEQGKVSNRLSSTKTGASTENYSYDGPAGVHGMLSMPHLTMMQWDYKDQLQATARQVVNNGGTPETTWYVYDSSGKRTRKITERQSQDGQPPVRMKERLYLGILEIYREYENDGSTVALERQTLHVMDHNQRISLVETRTQGEDESPRELVRYQLGNHLGTASLELDDQAQIISYEEYYPFGSTSYQSVRSQLDTPKRYRFTGKERDEESGLYYHGARYYAAWLGRWTSCDPQGLVDGTNLYHYANNNPIKLSDPSGTLSLGQWAGIVVGAAVGVVITVATAGLAGPLVGTAAAAVIGSVVGGAVGGAAGAAVETKIDTGKVSGSAVLQGAAFGAAAGFLFSGPVLSGLARSSAAKAIAGSAVGQFVKTVAQKVASSGVVKSAGSLLRGAGRSRAGQAVGEFVEKYGTDTLRKIHQATERAGVRISRATGRGVLAREEAKAAAMQARLKDIADTGGPSVSGSKPLSTTVLEPADAAASAEQRAVGGPKKPPPVEEQVVPHPPNPKPGQTKLQPSRIEQVDVIEGNGTHTFKPNETNTLAPGEPHPGARHLDAEFKNMEQLSKGGEKLKGTLSISSNFCMCYSCRNAAFQLLGNNKDLALHLFAPEGPALLQINLGIVMPMGPASSNAAVSGGAAGAVGATIRFDF